MRELEQLPRERDRLRAELDAVIASPSWRAGGAVTALPRGLRDRRSADNRGPHLQRLRRRLQHPVEELGRETPSCGTCRSTVRMREVAYLASVALFGTGLPIPQLPVRPHLRGIGLSDWWEYANRLAHRISYTNSWYHQEPRLDITVVPDEHAHQYDLVISSDVFEHVIPPLERAFAGATRLFKPGRRARLDRTVARRRRECGALS